LARDAGQGLSADEDLLVRSVFDEHQRAQAIMIVGRRAKLQRQAGTGAERDAAQAHRDATAAKLANQAPGIRAEIEQLQAELAGLSTDAAAAAAALDRMTNAVETLQTDPTLLSPSARSRYEHDRQHWERDFGIPSRGARQHAKALQELAGLDPADDDARRRIHDYCQREARTAGITGSRILERPSSPFVQIKNPGNPLQIKITVNGAAWTAHAAELREKAQALLAEAERLETAGASAKAAIDGMLVGLIPA
jgi:hypothetical protein